MGRSLPLVLLGLALSSPTSNAQFVMPAPANPGYQPPLYAFYPPIPPQGPAPSKQPSAQPPIEQAQAVVISPVGYSRPGTEYVSEPPCTAEFACDSSRCRSGLAAGVGFYFLKPHFSSNPAFVVANVPVLDINAIPGLQVLTGLLQGATVNQVENFEYDYTFSPRVWLAATNSSGLGIRTSWWRFDQSANSLTAVDADTDVDTIGLAGPQIFSAAPLGINSQSNYLLRDVLLVLAQLGANVSVGPGTMVFESDLRLDVWDVEATQAWDLGIWSLLASGGIRYAHMAQNYNVHRVRTATIDGTEFVGFDSLMSGHNFNGVGPTASFEAACTLGASFRLFASTRGSLLFGQERQRVHKVSSVTPDPLLLSSTSSGNSDEDSIRPVGEVEAGVEWNRNTGRYNPFVRLAFVAQVWFDAGNASNTDTIPNDLLFIQDVETGSNGSIGLVGLTLNTGIRY